MKEDLRNYIYKLIDYNFTRLDNDIKNKEITTYYDLFYRFYQANEDYKATLKANDINNVDIAMNNALWKDIERIENRFSKRIENSIDIFKEIQRRSNM